MLKYGVKQYSNAIRVAGGIPTQVSQPGKHYKKK